MISIIVSYWQCILEIRDLTTVTALKIVYVHDFVGKLPIFIREPVTAVIKRPK